MPDELIPCSVPILTLNNERTLETVLASVAPYFRDVYIMDGNSTDATVAIARRFGVTVYRQFNDDRPNQRIEDYTEMRRRLWAYAQEPWMFILDSDEYLTAALRDVVRNCVYANDRSTVYELRKLPCIQGHVIKHYLSERSFYPRIFPTGSVTLKNKKVHEQVLIPSHMRVVYLDEPLIEIWFSHTEFAKKIDQYVALAREANFSKYPWGHFITWVLIRNYVRIGKNFLHMIWITLRYGTRDSLPWTYNKQLLRHDVLVNSAAIQSFIKTRVLRKV